MSTLRVTIEQLVSVTPHPDPEVHSLELAQVGLYRAVVPKGVYKTGDYTLYIPEGAVLPDELIEDIGLTGRLAGKQKNRVKAVRLRGEISQGIVCRPAAITTLVAGDWDRYAKNWTGEDYAEQLGVTKYQPPIPTHMAGRVFVPERIVKWPDIENIKRYPTMFAAGEPVVATEKVHGTCFTMTFDAERAEGDPNRVVVSSKGYNLNGLAIERDPGNLYWRAVNAYSLERFADQVSITAGAPVVALFGEIYGDGVQDLTYGVDVTRGAPGFALFDIAVDYGDGVRNFLPPTEFFSVVDAVNEIVAGETETPVATVPVLYHGEYDEVFLLGLAEGPSIVGDAANIREGIVIRPVKESYSPITGDRKIGKIVGSAYLTRKGKVTEYE